MIMQPELDFTAASAAKERGMRQAVNNADRVHGDWSEQAGYLLEEYMKDHKQFLAEDFRVWCEDETSLPAPPSRRAFGAIMVRAAKMGLISRAGFASSKNFRAHNSTVTIWRTT